jgi:peptidoglycan-associated lipoprotein
MKYLSIFFGILILINLGCAQKSVQIPPSDQQHLQSIQQGKYDFQGDSKRKDGEILEEELARRERERLKDTSYARKDYMQFKDILFDFDSYSIKNEYTGQLDTMVKWLNQNKGMKITVEGHCDEKGTVEYNLALGQKRAEAVKTYLTKSGIEVSRVNTISYGKELPVDPGHDEEAWAKNRRASFKLD